MIGVTGYEFARRHVVFSVRSALKRSVFRRLFGPNFGPTFLKKSIIACGRYARGDGGSGDNVPFTLCVVKSICESSLKISRYKNLFNV